MWANLAIDFLSDPMFLILIATSVFILVLVFFYWLQKREEERKLEERLKRLKERQEKANQNKS